MIVSFDAKSDTVKVAFALLWTIDDMGLTTAAYDGIKYLEKELGDTGEVNYTEKVRTADAERVVCGYARQGYGIIFATTFEHMDPTRMVTKDFPDCFRTLLGLYNKHKHGELLCPHESG